MMYYLSAFHGLFNLIMFILFVRQGWLGIRIRRARLRQGPPPLPSIRHHRKNGPLFVILALAGFLFGLALVLISGGRLIMFPAHFFVGLAIVILLLVTYVLSRKIKRPVSPFRTPHFMLGILILLLYILQIRLGLGLLF